MGNLTKLTSKKIETLEDLYFLYQSFMAESSLGLPLPEWAYDYFPYGPLFDGIVAYYNITNFTPLSRRLYAGKLCLLMKTYTFVYIIKQLLEICILLEIYIIIISNLSIYISKKI